MDSLPPELRSTRGQIAAGLYIFSEATRLALGSRILRRLAIIA